MGHIEGEGMINVLVSEIYKRRVTKTKTPRMGNHNPNG